MKKINKMYQASVFENRQGKRSEWNTISKVLAVSGKFLSILMRTYLRTLSWSLITEAGTDGNNLNPNIATGVSVELTWVENGPSSSNQCPQGRKRQMRSSMFTRWGVSWQYDVDNLAESMNILTAMAVVEWIVSSRERLNITRTCL